MEYEELRSIMEKVYKELRKKVKKGTDISLYLSNHIPPIIAQLTPEEGKRFEENINELIWFVEHKGSKAKRGAVKQFSQIIKGMEPWKEGQ